MRNRARLLIVLLCSLCIFGVGTYRIFTENLTSVPLVVAYIFAITGFIGFLANTTLLIKKVTD
ncbi:hypothetical protein J6TS2_27610 [Heyndrickxia sporothermodurans]|nr:hypothetical protein J6TS2_27610 [Heyndrickxia sporothermodurans]